jgi:multidrug resistance protein, MATE family
MSWLTLVKDPQQNRRLWALALPMILSNITIPLLGLVDTAVMGHMSDAYYLGGVALGSSIITLIAWLLGFLRMATTGLTAQAFGAGDLRAQQQLLVQGCLLALLLGLGIILLQTPVLNLAMGLSQASQEVEGYCRDYFAIRVWSMPLALLNLVMLGWLLGRQQPRAAMWQLILANGANIVLDLVFVLGLGWDVKGVALASVLADVTAFMVAFLMVRRQLAHQSGGDFASLSQHVSLAGFSRLLRLNTNIFIRSLCLQATFTFMTFHGAALGDNVVAANAVLMNLLLLVAYGLDGIAYYAEAEVGRAWGMRNAHLLRNAVGLALTWSALLTLGCTFLLWLAGEGFIALLTDIREVRDTAGEYLAWLIALPLLSFVCYLFDGVYLGAAKGRVMRNSMLFSTLVVFFPVWYLSQSMGNHALWAAMSAFMLSRSLTLAGHYHYSRAFASQR